MIRSFLNAIARSGVCWDENYDPVECNDDSIALFKAAGRDELLAHLKAEL